MINILTVVPTSLSAGVAHYRLPPETEGYPTVVLTTHAAAFANDPSIRGAVQDWKFADLLLLVQAVHRHAIFCIFTAGTLRV